MFQNGEELKKTSVHLEMMKNLKSINTSENDEEFCFKVVKNLKGISFVSEW